MTLNRIMLAALCALAFVMPTNARALVIKLATVAPKDSAWSDYLQEVDRKWREASNGTVQLRIYAGTLGDESDIMRRIRIGQIDAATVTTVGLATVDPSATAMHIPLAFDSSKELHYVEDRITPDIEKVLREKGIVVINWGEGGWVRFFTKTPLQRPADLRKLKLFVWATGDTTRAEEIWKAVGVKPVPLSTVDILPALQTDLITAYQAPPLAALANQWFAFTNYMTDMKWAPLVGATIVSTDAWSKIPSGLQPRLMQIARDAGKRLDARVRQTEAAAIEAMTKRGLKLVPVPPDALQEWQKLTLSLYPEIRGRMIPVQYFDKVLHLRDEHRASNPPSTRVAN
jgi:TRAP-type C4-dicarboxylate transport system substrate-binding protein